MSNTFSHDLKWAARMLCSTIRDEDDMVIGFWEKLWVVTQVILGIIVIEHERR